MPSAERSGSEAIGNPSVSDCHTESQERQEGLEAFVEQRRRERGEREAVRGHMSFFPSSGVHSSVFAADAFLSLIIWVYPFSFCIHALVNGS